MERFDIVGLGEPLVEFNRRPGSEPLYLQGFGGDTMNAAVAAARLGARVAYVTRLGRDAFGEALAGLWHAEGVDARGVTWDESAPTGVYFVDHGPDGHRFSYLRRGSAASRMGPAELPQDLLRRTRFLHTSGITQAIGEGPCDAVFAAMATVRHAGGQVAYDANLRLRLWPLERARALILAAAARSDYFLLSLDDAEALSGLDQPHDILDWALGLGAATVVLKLGERGAVAATAAERHAVAGHRVDCVDATGAGDCFAGALLTRLSRGDALPVALAYANAAAALATTGFGAVAPLPRPADVGRLLSA